MTPVRWPWKVQAEDAQSARLFTSLAVSWAVSLEELSPGSVTGDPAWEGRDPGSLESPLSGSLLRAYDAARYALEEVAARSDTGSDQRTRAADEAEDASKLVHEKSAFAYPQLVLGMVAIFVYVGVEVSTIANLPAYLELPAEQGGLGIATALIAPFVSLYWASLMIGRWAGAAGAFEVRINTRRMLTVLLPYLAFGVFLAVNSIARHEISHFFVYGFVIVLMIAVTFASGGNPARMLLLFSLCGIAALLVGMSTSGMTSVVAFISVGLFCSIMWPCIFTLAITGLGRNTNQGSSLLIMMIMGGGIVSFAQGALADRIGIHYSFIVGVACFAYLAFYAARVPGILRKQGIDLDQLASGSGR